MRDKTKLKKEAEFKGKFTPAEIKNADQKIAEFISLYNQAVFKLYLSDIGNKFQAIPCELNNPEEHVAYFEMDKLVIDEKETIIDRLKNAYHVLSNDDDGSVSLILHRKQKECNIALAVGIQNKSSEDAKKKAELLQEAMQGNFPGISCDEVKFYSASDELFTHINSKNNDISAAIVSNIATESSENFISQGIEKLIDGIHPTNNDNEYTLIILGQHMNDQNLEDEKNKLYELYTGLSPLASMQKNWNIGDSEEWSRSWNVGGNIHAGIGLGKKGLLTKILKNITGINGANIGAGINGGFSHAHGTSINGSNGGSVEITDYKVKHTLETIESQMKRLEECAALGLWNFAAYVLSPDLSTVNKVAHMYASLTQGKESFYEKSSVNIWNAAKEEKKDQIKNIISNIRFLTHPKFKFKNDIDDTEGLNATTTTISGVELARALNLPGKSVPGFTVIKCASFGREVSSYDESEVGEIELGTIQHMHRTDDNVKVNLSKNSITSHAFITGSTGSGKSNTVYKLLSGLKKENVKFLVVEPAKGEYKYVFNDVNVYGTNPNTGELLRINPFEFRSEIHIFEHIDRLLEIFNVCWPMTAAMPAVLKDSVIRAYEEVGWDVESSYNAQGNVFPTFENVLRQIDEIINSSEYSNDSKGDYKGALSTRLRSLTNGVNGLIFCNGTTSEKKLFEENTIVDLSRLGSAETKSLIMGMIITKLQEYHMSKGGMNEKLKHVTVLEEAHNILKRTSSDNNPYGSNIAGKSVEMISNAIAEMRTYGEGFLIVDQSPGLMDMSVVRNTNTKIIMRLPEQSDRELVGKAASLNNDQIDELAKLQKGVAAVYQNEWIEPVLCKIEEFKPNKNNTLNPKQDMNVVNKNLKRAKDYVTRCVFNPANLNALGMDFIECVEQIDIPIYTKNILKDFYRTPAENRQNIWEKAVYHYFEIENVVNEIGMIHDEKKWEEKIWSVLNKKFGLKELVLRDSKDSVNFFNKIFVNGCITYWNNQMQPEKAEIIEKPSDKLRKEF